MQEPAAAAAAAAPTTSTALPPGPRSCMAKPRQESEEEDEESKKTVKWSDPVHDGGYMPAVAAAAPEPSFWQQAAWRMVVAEEQKEPADVMRAASLMVPELEAGLRSLVPHPTLVSARWPRQQQQQQQQQQLGISLHPCLLTKHAVSRGCRVSMWQRWGLVRRWTAMIHMLALPGLCLIHPCAACPPPPPHLGRHRHPWIPTGEVRCDVALPGALRRQWWGMRRFSMRGRVAVRRGVRGELAGDWHFTMQQGV
jgi:hypothetical protein